MSLSIEDDALHLQSSERSWRESYYFNFVDEERGISCFATIGIMPNLKIREFVFAIFYKNKKKIYYNELKSSMPVDLNEILSDGKLCFKLERPLKQWQIFYYDPEVSVDLSWDSRSPPIDFGEGSGTSWLRHFEQPGKVRGKMRLADGTSIEIDGLGQRDKSWGPRNWHIDGWFAMHAQFNELSIGLRRDTVGSISKTSGYILSGNEIVAISDLKLETIFSKATNRMPVGAKTVIYGSDGSKYSLVSKLMAPNTYAKFERDFGQSVTELYEEMAIHECSGLKGRGTGLIEWLITRTKVFG